MPEQICISCLFLSPGPERRLAIRRLFESEPVWMGQPDSYMILDPKGNTTEGNWPSTETEQPLNGSILFIYSKRLERTHPFRSCLSVDEGDNCAVYTMSFPLDVFKVYKIEEAEERLMHIYKVARSIGSTVLMAGPELEVKPTTSVDEALSAATARDSLTVWLIASAKSLSTMTSPFEVVKARGNVLMLKRPIYGEK